MNTEPMTGTRQTLLTWLKEIETLDELPAVYQSEYRSLVGQRNEMPHTVLAPPVGGSWFQRPSEKLLFMLNENFYVLENFAKRILIHQFPLQNIGHIEVGNILLYSWVKIVGMESDGNASSITIAYNTTTYRHLVPFIEAMRPTLSRDNAELKKEQQKFDSLGNLSFKFKNYARSSLTGRENVIRYLFQPEIRRPVFSLFGRDFLRTLSLTSILILTDQEIILINEDERSTESHGKRYGGVWRYIPLKRVLSAAVTENQQGLLNLSLHLYPDTQLDLLFEADKKEELRRLEDEILQFNGIGFR